VKLLLENLLFTLVIPGTVAVYLPLWLSTDRALSAGSTLWLGGLLVAVGVTLYAWCLWDFAILGRGTPAPIDAPKRLIVRGPYRCTRNPMYVGVLTVVFGWALVFRSAELLAYGAVVAGCFQGFVVHYEEPHLSRVFGREYESYRRRVGRWLW
jgi:protein-S-isoprenylcysteine O-methyltransferase Ste14